MFICCSREASDRLRKLKNTSKNGSRPISSSHLAHVGDSLDLAASSFRNYTSETQQKHIKIIIEGKVNWLLEVFKVGSILEQRLLERTRVKFY